MAEKEKNMAKKKKKGPTKSRTQQEAEQAAARSVPVTNPELKAALDRLNEQRIAANEKVVFDLVKGAKLLAPVIFNEPLKAENGRVQIPNGAQMRYVLVNASDGRAFFPVFTSIEDAKKMPGQNPEQVTYITRTLKDYEKLLQNEKGNAAGIALNPMTNNIIFSKDLVNTVLHGEEKKQQQEEAMRNGEIPAGVPVTYSEPSVYPTALVNAVYDACQTLDSVCRVWLKGMSAGTARGFALFVEQERDDQAAMQAISEAAVPLAKDVPVVVMKATEQIMKTVLKDDVALYDKEMEF